MQGLFCDTILKKSKRIRKKEDAEDMSKSKKEYDDRQFVNEAAAGKEGGGIVLTEEEMAERQKLIKYFNILFWMAVGLCAVGLAYMRMSMLMGTFNLVFGLLGIYFSRRYLKRLQRPAGRAASGEDRAEDEEANQDEEASEAAEE